MFNKLIPVEYQGQRVLTTAQLATTYATTHNTIKNVFARAKEQFQDGRDYFNQSNAEPRHDAILRGVGYRNDDSRVP